MKRRNILAGGMALVVPLFSANSQAKQTEPRKTDGLSKKTVAYGENPAQKLDVYLPNNDCYAWIIMVHGKHWRKSDKVTTRTIDKKISHWTTRGIGVASIDYRMLPEASVEVQLADVRSAISFLQRKGSTLGLFGPMVIMGHASGGHLVALAAAQIQTTIKKDIAPWAGTIIFDSDALDVPSIMAKSREPSYKNALGMDEKRWTALSPMHQLQPGVGPTMIVYSSTRSDDVELQAQMYAQRLAGFGVRNVQTLGIKLDSTQINEQLGLDNEYTRAVDMFLSSLHSTFERSLKR